MDDCNESSKKIEVDAYVSIGIPKAATFQKIHHFEFDYLRGSLYKWTSETQEYFVPAVVFAYQIIIEPIGRHLSKSHAFYERNLSRITIPISATSDIKALAISKEKFIAIYERENKYD